jgi:hypothetical protein
MSEQRRLYELCHRNFQYNFAWLVYWSAAKVISCDLCVHLQLENNKYLWHFAIDAFVDRFLCARPRPRVCETANEQ